jgi:hypothetical protein
MVRFPPTSAAELAGFAMSFVVPLSAISPSCPRNPKLCGVATVKVEPVAVEPVADLAQQ